MNEKALEEFHLWWFDDAQTELRSSCAAGWGQKIWQAARSSIEIELPDTHGDDWSGGYAYWADQVHAAIEAAGVKVKT